MKYRIAIMPMVAAIILAATMGASTFIGEQGRAQLQQTLNANSRGTYDLLVRASDSTNQSVSGYADSDFVNGYGGLSQADVNKIRSLPDVGIAAPIALAGSFPTFIQGPELAVEKNDLQQFLNIDPGEGLTITAKLSYNNGAITRTIYENETRGQAFSSGSTTTGGLNWANGESPHQKSGLPAANFNAPAFPSPAYTLTQQETMHICMPAVPMTDLQIIAIDPESESALLGDKAAFLDPLLPSDTWDRSYTSFANNLLTDPTFDINAEGQRVLVHPGLPPILADTDMSTTYAEELKMDAERDTARIIPMVASAGVFPGFRLEIGVESPSGTALKHSMNMTLGSLTALASPPVVKVDGELGEGNSCPYYSLPGKISHTTGLDFVNDGGALTAQANGTVNLGAFPSGLPATFDAPVEEGQRELTPGTIYRDNVSGEGQELDNTSIPAVVGLFEPEDISQSAGLSYVPLGGYDTQPMTTTINGIEKNLASSLRSTGLVKAPPAGITDLAGLADMRGVQDNAPIIDAIRVRVKAGSGAWEDQLDNILSTAADLHDAGYRVDVVAGASSVTTSFTAENWNGSGEGLPVQQDWSQLNAVGSIDRNVDQSSIVSFLLTTGAGAFLAAVAAVFFARNTRPEARILQQFGFTRRQIGHRILAKVLPSVAVVTVAAVITAITADTGTLAVIASVAVVLLFCVIMLAGIHSSLPSTHGSRTRKSQTRTSNALRVPTALRIATSSLASDRVSGLLLLAAVAVFAATSALTISLLGELLGSVGGTSLGALVAERLRLPNLILLSLGTGATLILATVLTRTYRARIAERNRVLVQSGWTVSMLRRCQGIEHGLVAGGATIAALLICLICLANGLGTGLPVLIVALGLPWLWWVLSLTPGAPRPLSITTSKRTS